MQVANAMTTASEVAPSRWDALFGDSRDLVATAATVKGSKEAVRRLPHSAAIRISRSVTASFPRSLKRC